MKDRLKIPPVSPLIGANFTTFLKVIANGKVKPSRWPHLILTSMLILLFSPFRLLDFFWFRISLKNKPLTSPPVFILGHWRSGTTFLHNLLCQIDDAAFVTTFQSVFPHHLKSKALIGAFMKKAMPSRRPGDNIKMDIDYPQEEEYALSNATDISFYHFFYYPQKYRYFYQQTVRFENMQAKTIRSWKNTYHKIIQKACANTNGKIPILKNPVNTSRIPLLLQHYPDSRFIHIVRNPVSVYCSTKKFFSAIIPTLSFQPVTTGEIGEMIFWLYEKMMRDYLNERNRIPEKQHYELHYETLLRQPEKELEKLMYSLEIPFSKKDRQRISEYLKTQRSHKTDHYKLSRKELDYLLDHWGFAMEQWGYSIPENVEIID